VENAEGFSTIELQAETMRGKSLREFSILRKTEATAVQAGTPIKA